MAEYESFEAVSHLETGALRNLLAEGDAQERVWAAWAFALKLGADSRFSLREAAQVSPTPGTRRHLIVILAGLGEREFLQAFAEDDPDDFVRATACQYLLRTWAEDDPQGAEFIQRRLLADSAAVVKETILKAAKGKFLPETLAELAELASNDGREVRRLAFELIKQRYSPKEAFSSALALRLHAEAEPSLLADLVNFCIDGDLLELVLESALRVGPSARLLFLDALLARDKAVTWSQIQSLAALGELEVDFKLLKLLQPEGLRGGFIWLAMSMAKRIPSGVYPDMNFFCEALYPFAEVIDRVPAAIVTAPCRQDLDKVRAYLKESVAVMTEDSDDSEDYYYDYRDEIAFYRDITEKIDAALRRS